MESLLFLVFVYEYKFVSDRHCQRSLLCGFSFVHSCRISSSVYSLSFVFENRKYIEINLETILTDTSFITWWRQILAFWKWRYFKNILSLVFIIKMSIVSWGIASLTYFSILLIEYLFAQIFGTQNGIVSTPTWPLSCWRWGMDTAIFLWGPEKFIIGIRYSQKTASVVNLCVEHIWIALILPAFKMVWPSKDTSNKSVLWVNLKSLFCESS